MYLVFDLETEVHQRFKRKANPFIDDNWVVARGWKKQGDKQASWTYHPTHDRTSYLHIPDDVTLLVGHNIKFDLLWEMCQNNPMLHEFYKRGGRVWDTQYVEYLLQGQVKSSHMCRLTELAPKYGGTEKIDAIKALWDDGVLTSDIPEDLLIDYLVGTEAEGRDGGDIGNTEKIFLGQIAKAKAQGMTKMIWDRMDGLCATTEMEYRGLKINTVKAKENLLELTRKRIDADRELQTFIPDDLPFEFSWSSPVHASCLIFGGAATYKKQAPYRDELGEWVMRYETQGWPLVDGEPWDPQDMDGQTPDVFKSGKRKGEIKTKKVRVPTERKTKWQDFKYVFKGYTEPKDFWITKKTDANGDPLYATNKDVIKVLEHRTDIPFVAAFVKLNALDKEIGTYYVKRDKNGEYKGMLTCVDPETKIVHHSLNHVNTVTTRLSSSDPNLQNLPRGDKSKVKELFVSRFEDGRVIEIDYSQLEVVVQGVLSKDKELCKNLNLGTDFHCLRVAAKHKMTYDDALDWCKNEAHPDFAAGKVERTKCKNFSFQRAYGAGVASVADETGMSLEETQELFDTEDKLFPGVVTFNNNVEKEVQKTAVPVRMMNDDGSYGVYRRGYWTAFTGTRYTFRSYDAPEWLKSRGKTQTFKPTEMKNYPIQGTGGEFVQGILGRLWRHFVSTDFYNWQAFMTNTVHDCVWFDVADSTLVLTVARDARDIMQGIPDYYSKRYDYPINVPFPVEVEAGPNMYDLHHIKNEELDI